LDDWHFDEQPAVRSRSMIPIDSRDRCDRNYPSFMRRLCIWTPDAAYMNLRGTRGMINLEKNQTTMWCSEVSVKKEEMPNKS